MAGKIALPHYGTPDDVEKVAAYLSGKPSGASEAELLKQLGTRCADPRKFELYDRLALFKRDGGVFRLTSDGKQYVEAHARKKRAIVQDAIRGFPPYHDILALAADGDSEVLEADRVKHQWAEHFGGELDLENAYRTSAAPMTFFGVCEMAGLGTFVVGRRGAKSRLELDRPRLSRYARGDEPDEADEEEVSPPPPAVELAPEPEPPPPVAIAPEPAAALPIMSSPAAPAPAVETPADVPDGAHTFTIPILGKTARLVWVRPTMTAAEWNRLKKVGDAMFLDE